MCFSLSLKFVSVNISIGIHKPLNFYFSRRGKLCYHELQEDRQPDSTENAEDGYEKIPWLGHCFAPDFALYRRCAAGAAGHRGISRAGRAGLLPGQSGGGLHAVH